MIAIRSLGLVVLLSAGLTAFVQPSPAPNSAIGLRRHTHLTKSDPASDDTLANSPRAIRLWFSEQVELPVTTVKLADASGTSIALAELARPDTGQAAPVTAMLKAPLNAGGYVVSWRTAAKDGHPASGTINFVVKAAH
jgi:methionine-rich copper-binding protein CopC